METGSGHQYRNMSVLACAVGRAIACRRSGMLVCGRAGGRDASMSSCERVVWLAAVVVGLHRRLELEFFSLAGARRRRRHAPALDSPLWRYPAWVAESLALQGVAPAVLLPFVRAFCAHALGRACGFAAPRRAG